MSKRKVGQQHTDHYLTCDVQLALALDIFERGQEL